ncbi:MAG TPA: hypothetical protein VMG82_21475 [Candidatus Sulfotelmatobacter sp.]|nr:hypothetical protein [Candidatus Sulfotelmatobacter sp.]
MRLKPFRYFYEISWEIRNIGAPRHLIKIASFVQYGLFSLHYRNSSKSPALARGLHSAPMNWDVLSSSDFTDQFAKSLSRVAPKRGWSSQSALGN